MPKHTTKDPAKRAEHIADREQENHIRLEVIYTPTGYAYVHTKDWPEFWLDTYKQSLLEIAGESA